MCSACSQLRPAALPPGPVTASGRGPAPLPATIHAAIYGEGPVLYVVSGGPDLLARWAAGDIPAKLLDADTSGKVYYFADAQAEGAWDTASRAATILYADGGQLLLALPAGDEPALLEAPPARASAWRCSARMPSSRRRPHPPPRQKLEAENVDPGIAALLAQLTTKSIVDRIAELSGQRPADIGGSTATLATRYTFAAGIRNAERYPTSVMSIWGYRSATPPGTTAAKGRTVVAELRGTLHPERIWLVGGHFDDISEIPYSRAPGADDNATGTAAALAIAGLLRGRRTADTIRFVHFSAEEQGHWGSHAYARSLSSAGSQVMGFLDLDMIGWDGNGDRTVEIHSGTRANSIDLAARFTGANQRYAQGLRVEVKGSSASRFSDHASFWDFGYPAFMAIENFFDDAIPRDRNPWYHRTGDLLSRIDLNYVVRTARTALAVLAEGAGWIPRRCRRSRRRARPRRPGRGGAAPFGHPHAHSGLMRRARRQRRVRGQRRLDVRRDGQPGRVHHGAGALRPALRALGVAPTGYRAEDEAPDRPRLLHPAPNGTCWASGAAGRQLLHSLPDDRDPDQRAGCDPDFLAPAGHPGGERRFPARAAAQTGELRPHRHGDEDAGRRQTPGNL